jgi:hypothetical protein
VIDSKFCKNNTLNAKKCGTIDSKILKKIEKSKIREIEDGRSK